MLTLFEKALVIHLICDWLLQNDHMALFKDNPRYPAGYIHAGIHLIGMVLIFPFWLALAVAVSHWLIDLRFILKWWRKFYRQTTEGPVAIDVAIWGDQCCHIAILAAAVQWGMS